MDTYYERNKERLRVYYRQKRRERVARDPAIYNAELAPQIRKWRIDNLEKWQLIGRYLLSCGQAEG
jgi:hypothetical protein